MKYTNSRRRLFFIEALLAFTAIVMVVRMNIVGILTLSDIILVILFPIVFFRVWPDLVEIRTFYMLVAIWLLGCIITDIYRQSDFSDYSRGIAMIMLFFINFSTISALCNWNINRILLFITSLYFSLSIGIYFKIVLDFGDDGIFDVGWKFGYGYFFTICVFLISTLFMGNNKFKIIGIILPFFAVALSLSLNARGLAGITAIAAVANAMVGRPGRVASPMKIIFALSICAVGGYVLIELYKYLAGSGMLGEAAQAKYLSQTQANMNIIQSGRTESLASIQAIKDSPIFGHGSWAKDKKYFELMVVEIEKAGGKRNYIVGDLIPSHSHLFGAWVQHGIAGAIFWGWVLILCIRAFYASISKSSVLSGMTAFLSITMIWDVLFSPFGLERRIIDPAIICYLIAVLNADKLAATAAGRNRGLLRRPMPRPAWRHPGGIPGRIGARGPFPAPGRSGPSAT